MMSMDIFQLFLNHLAERHHNNIYQIIQQDADFWGIHNERKLTRRATQETKFIR